MVISVRPIQDRDRNVEIARLTKGMDQALSQYEVCIAVLSRGAGSEAVPQQDGFAGRESANMMVERLRRARLSLSGLWRTPSVSKSEPLAEHEAGKP